MLALTSYAWLQTSLGLRHSICQDGLWVFSFSSIMAEILWSSKGRALGCCQLFCTLWHTWPSQRFDKNWRDERNCMFYQVLILKDWVYKMNLIIPALMFQSVEAPFEVFEESPQLRRAPPLVRVEKMFEEIQSKLPGAPKFLLCLLPERKNCDIYG